MRSADYLHTRFEASKPNGVSFFPRIDKPNAVAIIPVLSHYSIRQLTYEGDVLHAIAGILHAFVESCPDFSHHWGLPVISNVLYDDHDQAITAESRPWTTSLVFLLSLSWIHALGSIGRFERREGFPSWSWSGWKGALNFYWWSRNAKAISFSPDYSNARLSVSDTIFSKNIRVNAEMLDGSYRSDGTDPDSTAREIGHRHLFPARPGTAMDLLHSVLANSSSAIGRPRGPHSEPL
jgi:hypothetical protein